MKFNTQNFKGKLKRFVISAIALFQMASVVSYGSMIDENMYEIPISRGVTHKRVVQTFENGVQSIYLTIADLSDASLGLNLLYNKGTGFVNRKELSVLAGQNPNAVASINGDFFHTSDPSYSTGIMVDAGKMISSPSYKNGEMASMILDGNGNLIFDYLSSGVVLTNNSNGQTYNSISLNKHSASFNFPIIFTSEYRKMTVGSKPSKQLTEVVVRNGSVAEVRVGEQATQVPADGFVVLAGGAKGSELSSKFAVGDSVSLSSNAEQAYSNMVTAIGGGTMVLKDGQPTAITHRVKGKSQRTAIGVTFDNKLVFMVTDGRTGAYIGMNENDVASFLQSQNVKDAMMLDGGGSTELIINGKITNHLVGKERKLLNGISVVNSSPRGALSKLEAVLETDSIVQGDQVKLVVQGFDESMNPIALGGVSVSGSGVNVTYNNGYITANSGGTGSLLISSGSASTSIPINVVGINPNDPNLQAEGGAIDFAIVPNGSSDKNDVLGQVLNAKIVEKSANAKTAINMFNKSQELSNSLKGNKESIHQGGQVLDSSGVSFVGLTINKGIGGTSGQWTVLKNGLASANSNVVVMFNGSFKLNPAEKKLFRKLVNEAAKSKNVYVISYGDAFGSYAEGNVSYITVMDNAVAKGTSDADFKMLSMRNQNGKLSYSFEKLF